MSDDDFKLLSQEYRGEFLRLVKQKGVYPYEYRDSFFLMLNITKIELEVISDIDMYLFVEKGMGGDISYIAKRFCKANDKCMKCYDDTKPSKSIMNFSANDLYIWVMSQNLPYRKFK